MILRTIVRIFSVLIFCSCSQSTTKNGQQIDNEPNKQLESKSGLRIEYGPNLGTNHIDTFGIKHFYVHCTAIITNDYSTPIHLKLGLANEYEFPTFCNDTNKYKVFLLPEELTPDTATIYNNIVNGQHDF